MLTEIAEINPMGLSPPTPAASTSNSNVFAGVFASTSQVPSAIAAAAAPLERTSLSLSSPMYLSNINNIHDHHRCHYAPSPVVQPAAMSATALLQKAAQMGAAASDPSVMLRGLGLAVSSSTGQHPNIVKSENNSLTAGLGLGLIPSYGTPNSNSNSNSGLTNPMMFGNQPTTLDLLGLGMVDGLASPSNGLSALLTSFGSGAAFNTAYDIDAGAAESTDRKPNGPAML